MKKKKLTFLEILDGMSSTALSRNEMKTIIAGSGAEPCGGCPPGYVCCSNCYGIDICQYGCCGGGFCGPGC